MKIEKMRLKPCPYCGGKAFVDFIIETPYINAHHTKKCKMRPDTWLMALEYSLTKQAKAWNQRVENVS